MKKIAFIIYAAVIAATLFLASAFRDSVNTSIFSVVPSVVSVIMAVLGHCAEIGRIDRSGDVRLSRFANMDFKYSKSKSGEGSFEMIERKYPTGRFNKLYAGIYYVGGLIPIPFIFFLSTTAKIGTIAVFLLAEFICTCIALPVNIIDRKRRAEQEILRQRELDRELEEQRRREQMGKWK